MSVGKNSLHRAGAAAETAKVALPASNFVKVPLGTIKSAPTAFRKDERELDGALLEKYGALEPLLLWNDKQTLRLLRGSALLAALKARGEAEAFALVLTMTKKEAEKLAAAINTVPESVAAKAAVIDCATCDRVKTEPKTDTAAAATPKTDDIHEEKFRVIEQTEKQDMPFWLL